MIQAEKKLPALTTILWLILFSIAMGYMEAAVVIYLRKIFYPDGFQFPLVSLDAGTGLVEIFREAATIIMLVGVGILAAGTASLKFAFFLFCFAIWDLFYYFFLWVFLSWPQSLFTWDILFLIPIPWVGPVIAPCIISLTMLLLASLIIHFQRKKLNSRIDLKEWLFLITGSLVVILSFVWDYLRYTTNASTKTQLLNNQEHLLIELKEYVPVEFNWPLFITGEAILLAGILIFYNRIKTKKSGTNKHR